MAIASFFKRLFGTGTREPAAPVVAAARAEDPLDEARRTARAIDRRAQPVEWAQAHQILGHDLMIAAHERGAPYATDLYAEARRVLSDTLEASRDAGHDPLFYASLYRLRGEAGFQLADHLGSIDTKGETLAAAANDLGEALATFTPQSSYDMWLHAQLFRGAAFEHLARLKDGDTALAWLDEAAACFADVAARGTIDGTPHPIGAFNRYVVLEKRAAQSPAGEAAHFYAEARRALTDAMGSADFASKQLDLPNRLAALDEAAARA